LTPRRSMGRITETFGYERRVLRRIHPHMSFAARGKFASLITDNHSLDFSLGDGSPLARIYDLDGWILLLGVEHDNNTSLHLAEYRADFEGKKEIKQGAPIIVDDKRQWVRVRDWEEHSENFIELGKAYKKASGSLVKGKIGMADSLLIPQRELVDFGVNWIETNVKIQKKGSN